MEDSEQPTDDARDEAAERSLNEDLRQLAEDARVLAEAELAYQKSRASYAGKQAPKIAIAAIVALVFLYFAVMAAIMGTIIALAPLLTQWGAMGAVAGGLLLLTLIFAGLALLRVKRLKKVIGPKEREA
jgi:predicted anti-sigma-YlaC factor YlaD